MIDDDDDDDDIYVPLWILLMRIPYFVLGTDKNILILQS